MWDGVRPMNRPWSWYVRETVTIAVLVACVHLLLVWIG